MEALVKIKEPAVNLIFDLFSHLGISSPHETDRTLPDQKKRLLFLRSYQSVCEELGITKETCYKSYDFEDGGGEAYFAEGRLCTLTILPINEARSGGKYFSIDFRFFEDRRVQIDIGPTNIESEHQHNMFWAIFDVIQEPGFFISYEDGVQKMKGMLDILRADRNYYLKFWE